MTEQGMDAKSTDATNSVACNEKATNESIEEWRDIVGYEGLYRVSTHGNVYSLKTDKVMRFHTSGAGYHKVCLCRIDPSTGIQTTTQHFVHRLVALAFIPNPDNKPCIDHIDGNPSNNDVTNLRWATHKENSNNPISIQRIKEGVARAKAGNKHQKKPHRYEQDLKPIRCLETGDVFVSVRAAAAHFKISCAAVRSHALRSDLFFGARRYIGGRVIYHFEHVDNPAPIFPDRRLYEYYLDHVVVCTDTGEMWTGVNAAEKAAHRGRLGSRLDSHLPYTNGDCRRHFCRLRDVRV